MASKPERPAALAAIVLCSLLALSCSFDYGAEKLVDQGEQPTATFTGFVHRVVDKGKLLLEIRADRAAAYSKGHRTELEGVSFTQFGSDGLTSATGKANAATVYTDSENAGFKGNVRLVSKSEDSVLEAEALTWVSDQKTLSGGLERIVSVQRGDGAWVRGAGFEADLRRRSFSFQEATEGRFVSSEKTDGADTAPAPAVDEASIPAGSEK